MIYKKILIILTITLTLVAFTTTEVSASSYNYDYWKNIISSSEGLSHKDTYYGEDILNVNDHSPLKFDMLEDMAIYEDRIYLLDSANRTTINITVNGVNAQVERASTIYVLNDNFQWIEKRNIFPITEDVRLKLAEFYNFTTDLSEIKDKLQDKPYIPNPDGSGTACIILNDAKGITVTADSIYVADTQHNRVVKMDKETYTVTGVYLTPDDETFQQPDDKVGEGVVEKPKFLPIKLAIAENLRIYVVADRIYEGILEFSDNGSFNRFLGVNKVVANPLKAFWTKIMSETQIAQIRLDLPPMFTNISIYNNFLFTTSKPSSETAGDFLIKELNTDGTDILKRNGYSAPNGDPVYIMTSLNGQVPVGPSALNGITVHENGLLYTAIDTKRGHLFTYDIEGNLLYITGEKGVLSQNLNEPVAVRYLGDYVLVVDRTSRSIIVFETTEFGRLITEATKLLEQNKPLEAESIWREIVKMNTNYQLAYVGIGKSLLRQGRYQEAMENFKIGRNQTYYSKAFQGYRDAWLEAHFNLIMTSLVLLVVAGGIYKTYKYIRHHKENEAVNDGGDE